MILDDRAPLGDGWHWEGDAHLRYISSGFTRCMLIKQRIDARPSRAFGWYLFDGAGEPVLAGLAKDRHVWRTNKKAAQAVALCWVAGEPVDP